MPEAPPAPRPVRRDQTEARTEVVIGVGEEAGPVWLPGDHVHAEVGPGGQVARRDPAVRVAGDQPEIATGHPRIAPGTGDAGDHIAIRCGGGARDLSPGWGLVKGCHRAGRQVEAGETTAVPRGLGRVVGGDDGQRRAVREPGELPDVRRRVGRASHRAIRERDRPEAVAAQGFLDDDRGVVHPFRLLRLGIGAEKGDRGASGRPGEALDRAIPGRQGLRLTAATRKEVQPLPCTGAVGEERQGLPIGRPCGGGVFAAPVRQLARGTAPCLHKPEMSATVRVRARQRRPDLVDDRAAIGADARPADTPKREQLIDCQHGVALRASRRSRPVGEVERTGITAAIGFLQFLLLRLLAYWPTPPTRH